MSAELAATLATFSNENLVHTLEILSQTNRPEDAGTIATIRELIVSRMSS